MAVGESGRAVNNTVQYRKPSHFASRVGAHIHKGGAESTQGGGPGATSAPGASQQGSSGSSPYGSAGDQSSKGM